jgi:hypothetical protein
MELLGLLFFGVILIAPKILIIVINKATRD